MGRLGRDPLEVGKLLCFGKSITSRVKRPLGISIRIIRTYLVVHHHLINIYKFALPCRISWRNRYYCCVLIYKCLCQCCRWHFQWIAMAWKRHNSTMNSIHSTVQNNICNMTDQKARMQGLQQQMVYDSMDTIQAFNNRNVNHCQCT